MAAGSGWERFWLEPGIGARAMLAWRGVEAQHVVSTMRLVVKRGAINAAPEAR